jgi:hypothetical protein
VLATQISPPTTFRAATSGVGGVEPPDRSLSDEGYIAEGFPSPDRVWTSQDLLQASYLVQAIANIDPAKLPHCDSSRSARMFNRIVAAANLKLIEENTSAVTEQAEAINQFTVAYNRIAGSYEQAFRQRLIRGADMVEIYGNLLRMMNTSLAVANRFAATLNSRDPQYAVRLQGLEQIRSGFASATLQIVRMLSDTSSFSRADRLRNHLKSSFSGLECGFGRTTDGAQGEAVGGVADDLERERRAVGGRRGGAGRARPAGAVRPEADRPAESI